jgi:predicted nucleotidyltransferase
MSPKIKIDQSRIVEFCKRWKVKEFALFGSVLRDDFRPDSDVDVLLGFASDAKWDLFDLATMYDELQLMFGRKVDLVENGTIRNPFRRQSIMSTREILYAA